MLGWYKFLCSCYRCLHWKFIRRPLDRIGLIFRTSFPLRRWGICCLALLILAESSNAFLFWQRLSYLLKNRKQQLKSVFLFHNKAQNERSCHRPYNLSPSCRFPSFYWILVITILDCIQVILPWLLAHGNSDFFVVKHCIRALSLNRKGGAPFKMTAAKLRLAQAAMGTYHRSNECHCANSSRGYSGDITQAKVVLSGMQ